MAKKLKSHVSLDKENKTVTMSYEMFEFLLETYKKFDTIVSTIDTPSYTWPAINAKLKSELKIAGTSFCDNSNVATTKLPTQGQYVKSLQIAKKSFIRKLSQTEIRSRIDDVIMDLFDTNVEPTVDETLENLCEDDFEGYKSDLVSSLNEALELRFDHLFRMKGISELNTEELAEIVWLAARPS